MTEMIERVARALFSADAEMASDFMITPERWETTKRQRAYLALARAAIEAMREPTEAMLSAAGYPGVFTEIGDPRMAYRVMINAALKD